MCCGRAFLSNESYARHKESTPHHGKVLDTTAMKQACYVPPPPPPRPQPHIPQLQQTAINSRRANAFWHSRKENPPEERIRKYTQMEKWAKENPEDEEEEEDENSDVPSALE